MKRIFSNAFAGFFIQKIGVYPRLHLHLAQVQVSVVNWPAKYLSGTFLDIFSDQNRKII